MKHTLFIIVLIFNLGASFLMAKGQPPREIISIERCQSITMTNPVLAAQPIHGVSKRYLPLTERFHNWLVLYVSGYCFYDSAARWEIYLRGEDLLVPTNTPIRDADRAPPPRT